MWVRTQLKIGWSDLAAGLLASLGQLDRAALIRKAERYFGDGDDTIAAYSVRSGFELLIQALDLKPGDEVVFSALNVRGMVRIVKDAGLVPVPVDLDAEQMAPNLDRLKAALTPRARVFVAAHLFGARMSLDPLFDVARAQGIVAVEDCAQAFNGLNYPGSAAADVSMFSFGPIKTATALGGALIRVKPKALRQRMRGIQHTYPVQADAKQRKRILQFMALKLVMTRLVLGAIYRYHHVRGRDYEDALADRVRDVAPLKSAKTLRQQPSATMLWLMNRRLDGFDPQSLMRRTQRGEHLSALLGDIVSRPARGNAHNDFWVFPLVVGEPRRFITALRAAGFDAADLPRSQHIAAPADRPELEPVKAAQVLRDLIVVPCYDGMSDSELQRQAAIIRRVAGETASCQSESSSSAQASSAPPLPGISPGAVPRSR